MRAGRFAPAEARPSPTTAATWWIGPPAHGLGWKVTGARGARLARAPRADGPTGIGSRMLALAAWPRRDASGELRPHRGPKNVLLPMFRWPSARRWRRRPSLQRFRPDPGALAARRAVELAPAAPTAALP